MSCLLNALFTQDSFLFSAFKIDPKLFLPQWYTASYRLKMMLRNPLAVVEYFHTLINTIIEALSLQVGIVHLSAITIISMAC